MKRDKKKAAAAALMLLGCAAALAGCGDSGTDKQASDELPAARVEKDGTVPGWQQDNEEHVDLTWYVNATWWDSTWGEDFVTQKIELDTNVSVTFYIGDDTNLNTYFAGDELPDIITIFDSSSSAARTANEWALPLQLLADTYDPYFYEVASEDTLSWLALEDGYTYGYPGYAGSEKDFDPEYYDTVYPQQAFLIRQDVYEALEEPDMTTTEGFLDALTQISVSFPELIPLGFNSMTAGDGSLGSSLQNLLGVPLLDENNEWYDRQLDEDYLNWIYTLNQAYRAGYINDDSFADDDTAYEEKMSAGKYACVISCSVANSSGYLTNWYNTNPEGAYIAVEGPSASIEGRTAVYSTADKGGWTVSYITKDCSDPERAIELFTYLMSDYGEIITFFGIEGETYTINEDGKYVQLDWLKELRNTDPDTYIKDYRLAELCMFGHDRYDAMGECAECMEQIFSFGSDKIHQAGLEIIREQFSCNNISPDSGTEEARNLSNINTKWYTTLVSMIRASSDEEYSSIFDSYLSFREDNGFDSIVDVFNAKIAANREKLGYE